MPIPIQAVYKVYGTEHRSQLAHHSAHSHTSSKPGTGIAVCYIHWLKAYLSSSFSTKGVLRRMRKPELTSALTCNNTWHGGVEQIDEDSVQWCEDSHPTRNYSTAEHSTASTTEHSYDW